MRSFMTGMYWFQKDIGKQWLPVGNVFQRFVSDKRAWPGSGKQGLQLLQVGVSTAIDDINVPHIAIPLPAQQQKIAGSCAPPDQQQQQRDQDLSRFIISRFLWLKSCWFYSITDIHSLAQRSQIPAGNSQAWLSHDRKQKMEERAQRKLVSNGRNCSESEKVPQKIWHRESEKKP